MKLPDITSQRFNASLVFFQKLAHTGLTFLTAIVLARITGAEGYGAYAFAISWVTITTLLGMLGFDKLLIRELAKYFSDERHAEAGGMLRKADQIVLGVSGIVGLLMAAVGLLLIYFTDEKLGYALLLAIPIMPMLAIMRLRQSAMEGRNMAGYGNFPELVIMPALLIIAIGGGYLFWQSDFTAYHALILQWVAAAIALMTGHWQLRKYIRPGIYDAEPVYHTKEWVAEALPLVLISGLYVINANTDTIMLGFLRDSDHVGIYAAANKATSLIVFVQLAVNKTLSPDFSSLYHQGLIQKLQALVTRSVRWMSLASAVMAGLLILVGPLYFWLYGPEFSEGYTPLIILCVAKAVTSAMGSVSFLLIMTGHQRVAARNVGISAAINIILNATLIPMLGVVGAALATAGSLLILNVLQTVAVYKKTGINPTVFKKYERSPIS